MLEDHGLTPRAPKHLITLLFLSFKGQFRATCLICMIVVVLYTLTCVLFVFALFEFGVEV